MRTLFLVPAVSVITGFDCISITEGRQSNVELSVSDLLAHYTVYCLIS